eukprot:3398250-Amphidinium_carterae.1
MAVVPYICTCFSKTLAHQPSSCEIGGRHLRMRKAVGWRPSCRGVSCLGVQTWTRVTRNSTPVHPGPATMRKQPHTIPAHTRRQDCHIMGPMPHEFANTRPYIQTAAAYSCGTA